MNALKAIQDNCGLVTYNLGTGKGYSVLELVEAFERVNGIKIPYVIDDRRAGDVPVVYSDPSKAVSIPGLVTPVSGPSETSIPGNRKP